MRDVEFNHNGDQAIRAAKRYETIIPKSQRLGYDRINLVMDLQAADGVNGNRPLDWGRLLTADDFNFLHDISGISRHMNRTNGRLSGNFLPRFTAKAAAKSARAA